MTNLSLEIDHLTKNNQNSNCAFIRNGNVHGAEEALDHILINFHARFR